MPKKFQHSSNFFLIAVGISAKLNDILSEARNISLEAMNAKALVARAGDNVRTFKPITDFMVTLADETILLVNQINSEAHQISSVSVDGLKDLEALNKFNKAQEMAVNAEFVESIEKPYKQTTDDLRQLDKEILIRCRKLIELLDEIEQKMLAVQVATSTSKLEAARISEMYQKNFETIVFKFEKASKVIRKSVLDCRKTLINNTSEMDRITFNP